MGNLKVYWAARSTPNTQIKNAFYCLLLVALLYWHPSILHPIDALFSPLEWASALIQILLVGAALCALLALSRIADKTSALEIGDRGLHVRFAKLWGGRNIFVPWEKIHSCEPFHSARQFFPAICINMHEEKPEQYGFSSSQISHANSLLLPPPTEIASSAYITLYFLDRSAKDLAHKINEALEQWRTAKD